MTARNRTKIFKCKLSTDEHAALEAIAARDGVALAAKLRSWIRRDAPELFDRVTLDAVIRTALASGCDESGQITEPLAAALSLFVGAIALIVVYVLVQQVVAGLLAGLPF